MFTELTKNRRRALQLLAEHIRFSSKELSIQAINSHINEDNMKYYKAWFKRETGKEVKFFTVWQQKERSATKAVYMEKYADDFKLDMKEVNEFVEWIKN